MKLERAKGTRDFKPEEKIIRQYVVDLLRKVFEKYGYNPIETPVIERYEVLSAKFGAGEESDALKEAFTLKDQGNRKLALRFDLTVPLARFIAMNPNLKMPFKRYQIGRVYRDGPVKLGRLREFWQCDVDVVGVKDVAVEAELMKLVKEVFDYLDFKFYIEINNRKLLDGIFDDLGIKDREKVIIVIDKLKKIGFDGVKKELLNLIDEDKIIKLMYYFDINGGNEEKIKELSRIVKSDKGKEGLAEIKKILSYSELFGIKEIIFNPSLARGFSYYTGPVFEVYVKGSEITSSFAAGGRYDDMIGKYSGKDKIPATGISFGLEVITEQIKKLKKIEKKSVVDVYVIPIKTIKESLGIVNELRKNDINADIDFSDRSISKNLDYCDKLGIDYVVFVGEMELKENKIKLRNMKTGKEELLTTGELIERVKQNI